MTEKNFYNKIEKDIYSTAVINLVFHRRGTVPEAENARGAVGWNNKTAEDDSLFLRERNLISDIGRKNLLVDFDEGVRTVLIDARFCRSATQRF